MRRIVGKSRELLTWRSACAWLEQHEDSGLAGDVLWAIKHDAEVPWQGELVAWTWICHDRPEGLLYDLLMRSSDELLGRLWQSGGSFVRGQESCDLGNFAVAWDELEAWDELDWLDVSIDEIVARLGGRTVDVSPSRQLNP